MRKKYLLLFVLALAGCESNLDNNKALEYEKLDVNFSIKTNGFDMPENSIYGIAAFCARNNQVDVQMNENQSISAYKSLEAGESSKLVKGSATDVITATAIDHNFEFYAVYPYYEGSDLRAVPASVPDTQYYDHGVQRYLTFTAHTRVTSIVPTANLEATTPFAVLNLSVPKDIVEEGTPSTLKLIRITPANTADFSGALAGKGTIDAETGEFTLVSADNPDSIILEFPSEGLSLQEASTVIPIVVLPFTVPKQGFNIEFVDINGKSYQTSFLNQDSDEGTMVAAGSVNQVSVTRQADGVVPVSFPVEFPLGKVDNVVRFTASTQPKWVSDGLWTCPDQPQAYAQWHKVSDPSALYQQFREIVNSGDISTPGIKGVWTGDYLEFVIPVKNFAANSKIKMEFPFYGRQEPIFWNVKYLDGEEWKTVDLHNETSYDAAYTKECTFSLEYDVIRICSFTMTFDNEIKSGYLKFRLECADGSVTAKSGTATEMRDIPYTNSSGYAAPCYFRTDRGVTVKEISFTSVP